MTRNFLDSVLFLDQVNFAYERAGKPVNALVDVSLSSGSGEMIVIRGPSGCGKTTLLTVVAGIASPSSGKVCILGQDLTRSGDADRRLFRLKNIGFIFQNYYLLHSLTVLENAMLPLLMLGSTPEEAKPIASAFLEKVYLEGYEEAFPEELSFGEMQRVATVRALIHNPTVLICDEPTAALDQKSGGKVMEILQELVKEKGCTAIITTHDERILPYASSVFQMIDGKLYP